MFGKEFAKLCTPAKIYFTIAAISSIIALFNGFRFMVVFWRILIALVWTYILSWLCKKGFRALSWFIVLLPYIILLLAMFRIYTMSNVEKEYLKMLQLQDAYGGTYTEGFSMNDPGVIGFTVAIGFVFLVFFIFGSGVGMR